MPEFTTSKDRKRVENFHRLGEDVVLGKVVIDLDKCTGCAICTRCCAASALEVVDKKSRMVKELPFCMSCGDCVAICPEGAIAIETFIEFKHYFRYLDRGEPEGPRKF